MPGVPAENIEIVTLPEVIEESKTTLRQIVDTLGVSRDILASNDEIQEAWSRLPRVLGRIPRELRSAGMARMCVAVSAGLFDSALNYIWNDAIIELRGKVKRFGLNIVGQLLSISDFDERKLLDFKDYELLDICLKLNLITEDGFFFLDQCREIRNNFSSAHPTIGNIDENELISFVNRCARHALGNEENPVGVNPSDFINALKSGIFTDEQHETWCERLSNTHEAQRELLFSTSYSLYCDPDISGDTRSNAIRTITHFKEVLTPSVKSILLDKHQNYRAQGSNDKYQMSLQFFERLGIVNLLTNSERHSIVSKACERLLGVHLSMNNFYNEPPFAERLLEISLQGEIPATAKEGFVDVIVSCCMGNMYGVSNAAYPSYQKIIQNFSQREVGIMFNKAENEDSQIGRKIRAYPNGKRKFKEIVRLLDPSIIDVSARSKYEKWMIYS